MNMCSYLHFASYYNIGWIGNWNIILLPRKEHELVEKVK